MQHAAAAAAAATPLHRQLQQQQLRGGATMKAAGGPYLNHLAAAWSYPRTLDSPRVAPTLRDADTVCCAATVAAWPLPSPSGCPAVCRPPHGAGWRACKTARSAYLAAVDGPSPHGMWWLRVGEGRGSPAPVLPRLLLRVRRAEGGLRAPEARGLAEGASIHDCLAGKTPKNIMIFTF
eukprot:COSAG01_NODE_1778_length_9259_cov_4.593668_2_plen_178_part_00